MNTKQISDVKKGNLRADALYHGSYKLWSPHPILAGILQQENLTALWQHSSKGDGKSYGASSMYVDENFCYDEKLFWDEAPLSESSPSASETKSLYTVKIRQGSWYIRKRNDATSSPIKIISGNVTLQASQKRSGWYYLPSHNGWIGPAAISHSTYNKAITHTVKSGENLTIISKKYGVTIDEIVSKNIKKYKKITRNYIQTGWVLSI